MAGVYSLVAACYACGQVFCSNPRLVPSFGNQPICQHCMDLVNARRLELGQPRWPVHRDAYEPADESDMDTD